jgi:hypothetical protein
MLELVIKDSQQTLKHQKSQQRTNTKNMLSNFEEMTNKNDLNAILKIQSSIKSTQNK